MQDRQTNASPDVIVATTVAEAEIGVLAVTSLQPHDIVYMVTPRRTPAGTVQVSSAFEILDLIISAPFYSQAIFAAAAALGAGVLKVTTKLLDTVASEAGKDLYRWFKDSVTTALRRTREAHSTTRDRLSLRVASTIRETPIKIQFNAANLSHDPKSDPLAFSRAVDAHIDFIFGKVLPLVSEILRTIGAKTAHEEVYVECWIDESSGLQEINVAVGLDVAFQFQHNGELKFLIALNAPREQAIKEAHGNFVADYFASPAA